MNRLWPWAFLGPKSFPILKAFGFLVGDVKMTHYGQGLCNSLRHASQAMTQIQASIVPPGASRRFYQDTCTGCESVIHGPTRFYCIKEWPYQPTVLVSMATGCFNHPCSCLYVLIVLAPFYDVPRIILGLPVLPALSPCHPVSGGQMVPHQANPEGRAFLGNQSTRRVDPALRVSVGR